MNIVFDLDGTLIDSAPDIQFVAARVLRGLGKEELTLDETRDFIGEGSSVFVHRMMAARGIAQTQHGHTQLHTNFLTQYECSVDRATFYPGVLDVLAVLKAAGHRLGLCTNKPEWPTRAVLRHMGLESTFDALLAGGMLDSRKPEPAMLQQVIEELGGGKTLFVGDSEIDAETAKRAQVPFALFSGGYRKTPVVELHHDWFFDDFYALPSIVGEAMVMVI